MKNTFKLLKKDHFLIFQSIVLFLFVNLFCLLILNACGTNDSPKPVLKADKAKDPIEIKQACVEQFNKCDPKIQKCDENKKTCDKQMELCDSNKKKCLDSQKNHNNTNGNGNAAIDNSDDASVIDTPCSSEHLKCLTDVAKKYQTPNQAGNNNENLSYEEVQPDDIANLQKALVYTHPIIEAAFRTIIKEKEDSSKVPSKINSLFQFTNEQLANKNLNIKTSVNNLCSADVTQIYSLAKQRKNDHTVLFSFIGCEQNAKKNDSGATNNTTNSTATKNSNSTEILSIEVDTQLNTFIFTYNINKAATYFKEILLPQAQLQDSISCNLQMTSATQKTNLLDCKNLTYDFNNSAFYIIEKLSFNLDGIQNQTTDNGTVVFISEYNKWNQTNSTFKKEFTDSQKLSTTSNQLQKSTNGQILFFK